MLAGLTDDFKPLVMAVENSKEKLTVDMVKNVLLQDAKFDKAFEKESASQSKGVKKAVNGDEHTHIRWIVTMTGGYILALAPQRWKFRLLFFAVAIIRRSCIKKTAGLKQKKKHWPPSTEIEGTDFPKNEWPPYLFTTSFQK
uniref:Uncharacterized protein n=1 Tax=Stomoxys calcitrans TaxID=35570 RepID=A0A1I8Q144_STOCA